MSGSLLVMRTTVELRKSVWNVGALRSSGQTRRYCLQHVQGDRLWRRVCDQGVERHDQPLPQSR